MSNEFDAWDTSTDAGLTDQDLHRRFDEYLDEVYGEAKVAWYTFSASRALKELDEPAYDEAFNNWFDSELENGILTEDEPTDDEEEEDA